MPPFFVDDMTESQKAEYFAFLKTVNESKGGQKMSCNHEKFRTVGDRLFCLDCGEELPIEMLTGGRKQGKNPPADDPADKPATKATARKKAAKKAE